MIVRINDGTQVDLLVGAKVILVSPVFGDEFGTGPFDVVEFQGDLPVVKIAEDKTAPVSPELIVQVISKPVEKVEVTFPDGTVVLVDASLAPVIQAIIDANTQLMQKLADLLSGEELRNMQAQLDAMKAERDAALAFVEKIRGALPRVVALQDSLSEIVALLEG